MKHLVIYSFSDGDIELTPINGISDLYNKVYLDTLCLGYLDNERGFIRPVEEFDESSLIDILRESKQGKTVELMDSTEAIITKFNQANLIVPVERYIGSL